MLNISKLQDLWIDLENKRLVEGRKYPHFDPIVNLYDKKSLVFDKKNICHYSFFPLIKTIGETRRRKWDEDEQIRKIDVKKRPICYAAHLDALIFSWYGFLFNTGYEKLLYNFAIDDVVLAYRRLNKSTPDFVKSVGDWILSQENVAALCFDVTGFFDNLDHALLKKNLSRVIFWDQTKKEDYLPEDCYKIFCAVTKPKIITKKRVESCIPKSHAFVRNGRYAPDITFIDLVMLQHKRIKSKNSLGLLEDFPSVGIPQGLPLSGALANIAMLDFDIEMKRFASEYKGIYRRYSDDILLVISPEGSDIAKQKVNSLLANLGLKANKNKEEVHFFTKQNSGMFLCKNEKGQRSNFQYLGIEFDGNNYYIRSQSMSRFYRNLKKAISRFVYKKRKLGVRVFKYREFFKRYLLLGENQNFFSYTMRVHEILKPFSRIDRQINANKIIHLIKNEIKKRI